MAVDLHTIKALAFDVGGTIFDWHHTIREAINDYKKATQDPVGTLDLMVHDVECGTQFAVEYHDGDEEFCEDLDEMFTQVVKALQQSEQELVDKFLPRLRSIVRETEDIGWGYGDAVYDTLEDAFPE